MLVTTHGRLAGVDIKLYTTNSFTVVKTDSTFLPYIEREYKKGIVQGIGSQQFAPDWAITRDEIALIFANYATAAVLFSWDGCRFSSRQSHPLEWI